MREWENIDRVIARYPKDSLEYIYYYSIRNSYAAYSEMAYRWSSRKYLLGACRALIRAVINVFIASPMIVNPKRIMLLEIDPITDGPMAKKMDLPLLRIKWKKGLPVRNNGYFLRWLRIAFNLFGEKGLNKRNLWLCLPEMLTSAQVYNGLNLAGIEKIATQRDRYPVELAILRKAREKGIKTIKIDYFQILGEVCHNTIFCEYYFCPNRMSKELFGKFEQNSGVKYIDGGFPYRDYYAEYPYSPKKDPRIITFFTQYGYEIGLFGDKGPSFYIEEIISNMPTDHMLYIKVHPLEDHQKYLKYRADNVKVVASNIDNCELYAMSSHIFTIFSAVGLEAKHINPNSYYINYEPERVIDFRYDLVEDYIDVIKDWRSLLAVFNGERKPKSIQRFLEEFNPTYPGTAARLSEAIKAL